MKKTDREDDKHKFYLQKDINYDSVANLTYLDWCLKESLRLNPLASTYIFSLKFEKHDPFVEIISA